MANKKTLRAILVCVFTYMLLSWFIVAGNFNDGNFSASGFNQVGLFDLFLAPFELFNYFVVTMTKNINGYVNKIGYGNIIMAFISIGIFYGILNKTGAYYNLVKKIGKKIDSKKDIFLLIVASIFCILSALTGLNLILFMFFPFLVAVLSKLNYSKITIFTATIGAMLIGQIGSLYNPNINGLNRIMFQLGLNSNIISRLLLLIMLLVVLLASLVLCKNKFEKKTDKILFLEEADDNRSCIPIIIITSVITVILFICMYNWYYMFNSTTITQTYNNIMEAKINNYNIAKNIFGMSEAFGYWTGFTMSALLLVESIILTFIYNVKFDKIVDGVKTGLIQMLPTVFCCIISLVPIVISLNNSDSFLYSIINNIFNLTSEHNIIGVFISSLLHNFFINDYFALLSSLSKPLTTVYGYDSLDLSLLITQISHGLVSLITPFSVYLIAGLTYLKLSYVDWIKYIWKTLLIIVGISIVVLLITANFA